MTPHKDALEKARVQFMSTLNSDASDLAKRMNAGMSAQKALELYMADAGPGAIAAYLAAMREQGFAMMPREASEAMVSQGFKARDELTGKSFPRPQLPSAMWRAMFDSFANSGDAA